MFLLAEAFCADFRDFVEIIQKEINAAKRH